MPGFQSHLLPWSWLVECAPFLNNLCYFQQLLHTWLKLNASLTATESMTGSLLSRRRLWEERIGHQCPAGAMWGARLPVWEHQEERSPLVWPSASADEMRPWFQISGSLSGVRVSFSGHSFDGHLPPFDFLKMSKTESAQLDSLVSGALHFWLSRKDIHTKERERGRERERERERKKKEPFGSQNLWDESCAGSKHGGTHAALELSFSSQGDFLPNRKPGDFRFLN
jgi:hypothetical protein